jgi:aryl-alcohol dehydrogenase-like predicted oxidoreductase
VLAVCDELGICFVPWSPLGQGFLTGTVSAAASFEPTDVRSRFPRFTPEARHANQPIVVLLQDVAHHNAVTPAQVALAWLLARRPWIVPIPGTRKLARLEENLAAASLELSAEDLRQLDEATSVFRVEGARGTGSEQYG